MSDGVKKIIRLDRNEVPFDVPKNFKSELVEIINGLEMNRYPEDYSEGLREKIGRLYGLSADNVIVGNGSDQVINFLFDFLRNTRIVTSTPTFSMYRFFAEAKGIDFTEIPMTRLFQPDADKLLDVADSSYIVCSPNNPTGDTAGKDTVRRLLETGKTVIVDEAYGEFDGNGYTGMVRDYDNLIILRTFSKAFGLAGLRIGYSLSSPETTGKILKTLPPFVLGTISLAAAGLMLDYTQEIRENVDYIIRERERIYREISAFSFPSRANFILVKLDAYEFLRNNGILVRKLNDPLNGMIRVTVGLKQENDVLISALKSFYEDFHQRR